MPDQTSLFESDDNSASQRKVQTAPTALAAEPLASRMRPRTLDEIIGQEHLLAPGRALRRSIEEDRLPSIILWGPPGSGKTTLAEVIARQTRAHFVSLSAVSAGVADLRKVVEDARKLRQFSKQRTILFIDEIHRFNKAQQDAVLPHVERGAVTLIGATTENPSFEVNAALLSRCRVFTLKALTEEQILTILKRALHDNERGLGQLHITIDENALQQIAIFANGDARTALNVLELAATGGGNGRGGSGSGGGEGTLVVARAGSSTHITLATVEDIMQHRALLYDKAGDQHYDTISALHKSLRGSDPDAALYWLARMLEAGEDPLYIVRRLIRFASEDVGMADPQALLVCVAAQQAVHFVGLPEANLALAQAVVHLATAPKSNALYEAYSYVQEDVQKTRNDPVPLQIRNAPTQLMKDLDYGKDYKYAHDYYKEMQIEDPERPPAVQLQEYLPESLKGRRYYEPGHQGKEASIKEWLEKRRANSKVVAVNPQAGEQYG
ncbi:MAG TPA: replication-associated recombination protein A [Ktedonobacteraceae bacterium]|nr:replication-associated recombination protein A [Ktedonobacteraceae bacterium]